LREYFHLRLYAHSQANAAEVDAEAGAEPDAEAYASV
jgi:hypothetical protein